MAKPFDATARRLIESDPAAWLGLAHLAPDGPLSVLPTNLPTIQPEADAVIRVDGPAPWIVHFEFQAGADPSMGGRLLRDNVLLGHREGLPVQSVVVLLRPSADDPSLTGLLERRLPDGRIYHSFRYLVVRPWQIPAAILLEGPLAALPLAPVSEIGEADLPGVLRRIEERIDREAPPEDVQDLRATTFILMGLKYPKTMTQPLLRRIRSMVDWKESSVYEILVEEIEAEILARSQAEWLARGQAAGLARGQAAGARRILMRQGTKRLGPPDARTIATVEAIDDPERIEALADRLLDADVTTWGELLGTPRIEP